LIIICDSGKKSSHVVPFYTRMGRIMTGMPRW
jgi:hypothetical protein